MNDILGARITQTAIRSLTTKYEIFKVVPKWSFLLPTKKYEIRLLLSI